MNTHERQYDDEDEPGIDEELDEGAPASDDEEPHAATPLPPDPLLHPF